jgi:DNA-binding NtrC family response regulator
MRSDRYAALTRLPLREAREVIVDPFERTHIAAQLREQHGVIARTAEAMGVSQQLLRRRMVRYGLPGA